MMTDYLIRKYTIKIDHHRHSARVLELDNMSHRNRLEILSGLLLPDEMYAKNSLSIDGHRREANRLEAKIERYHLYHKKK